MSGQHILVAANALTNVPIAELPVSELHFSRVLNDNGVLEAQILLSDAGVSLTKLLTNNALEPGYVSLYCMRDNVPVWGGLLWAHSYDSTSGILTIDGAEFGSYLSSRFIMQNTTYNADVATLAVTWVSQVFADGGPLDALAAGLPSASTLTGTTLKGTFYAYEQHCVADLLTGYVAQNPGGIDWSFDMRDVDINGNPRPTFVVSAPRRGRNAVATGVQWDYPFDLASLALSRNAQAGELATELIVTGAGSGATLLQASKAIPVPGYIKLQSVVNDGNLATQAAVNNYAVAEAQTRAHNGASMVFGAVILGSSWYGSGVDTGDEVCIRITDPYYPGGALLYQRIIGYDVTPATSGAPELVGVTFGDPLVNIG
jgi:hypothetical protein